MRHDFLVVWGERGLLLSGLGNTVVLSLAATIAALGLGAALAPGLMAARGRYRLAFTGFVDGLRCIPFLLFAYIVYYGLPSQPRQLDRRPSRPHHLQHRLHGGDFARRVGNTTS